MNRVFLSFRLPLFVRFVEILGHPNFADTLSELALGSRLGDTRQAKDRPAPCPRFISEARVTDPDEPAGASL